jgi:hypothetical protein
VVKWAALMYMCSTWDCAAIEEYFDLLSALSWVDLLIQMELYLPLEGE